MIARSAALNNNMMMESVDGDNEFFSPSGTAASTLVVDVQNY